MRQLVRWIIGCAALPGLAVADVCAPGGSLRYPDYAVLGRMGLSVVVELRDHPVFAQGEGMTVAERAAALGIAFEDAYGDEPEGVQDLRRLAAFVQHFRLAASGEPSISNVFTEPEYLMLSLPVLGRLDIPSGEAALRATAEAFWFLEDARTDQLLTQLMWNSVIGATIDDARAAAPGLLIQARGEVDTAVQAMEASDPSVEAVMTYAREGVSDAQRRWFLEYALERCLDYDEDWRRPSNWDNLPQPQKDLLVLMLLEYRFEDLTVFFADAGWLLGDALRVTQEQGLIHYAAALREGLALFPADMPKEGPEWEDMVWAQAGRLHDIAHDNLHDALRAEQDPMWGVDYDVPVRDAFENLAKQTALWPGI